MLLSTALKEDRSNAKDRIQIHQASRRGAATD